MNTAAKILAELPYKLFPSQEAYIARNYHALKRKGYAPIKASYDDGGNCLICGEAGRCPGWHIPEEASLSDEFTTRQMPNTPIRKPSKGIDGLPLFDPKVKHEHQQEKAQQKLF
jgi:hypothetical protein